MPDWGAFAGFLAVLTVPLILLARTSSRLFRGEGSVSRDGSIGSRVPGSGDTGPDDPRPGGTLLADYHPDRGFRRYGDTVGPSRTLGIPREPTGTVDLPTGTLLANVVATHGLFGALLLAAVGFTRVPLDSLGVAVPSPGVALVGVAFGGALWVGNELAARRLEVAGFERSEALREAMAPESTTGWLVLFGLVLPLVAGFEELLFRGAYVGALAAGFGVSPWVLAVGSSALFAYGHGAQGAAGMLVTGLLGMVLAAAFVASGSLALVLIAHYVVNALEFGVHELAPRWRTPGGVDVQ